MILMYHKVHPEAPTMWWVKVDEFRRQMEELRRYKVVSLDEYDPGDPSHAVITFDGVYENVYSYALPVLKKFGYPFELFIVGSTVGMDNKFDQPVEPPARFSSREQLKSLVEGGGRLQWHSRSHTDLSAERNPERIKMELTVPDDLKRLDPSGFRWFAYPHGRHNQALIDIVKRSYSGALSCVEGDDHDRYQLNRITVTNETGFSKTTVSLIIANYNYGRYLPEAIESALHQTVKPDEIVFIDDCSVDNSMEIAGRYKDRIRIIRNEKNLGIVDNFNKAVSLTTGDYICFLGADNRFRSDYVERCKYSLDMHEDAAVAYTDAVLFGPRAEVLAHKVGARPVSDVKDTYLWQFADFNDETKKTLRQRNFIHGSSMYRRKAFEQIGGYRKSNGPEDHNLFIRMVEKGWKAVHVPEYLLEYRQHSSEQANTSMNYALELAYYRRKLKESIGQNNVLRKKLAGLQAQLDSGGQAGWPVSVQRELDIVRQAISEDRPDDALHMTVSLFRRFPEHSLLFYYFGLALARKGDLQSAESALKYSVFHDPSSSTALNDLGVIKYQAGKKEEAVEYYRRALESDPGNISAMKNLADFLLVEQNNPEEAAGLYLKVLEKQPEDMETLLSLGHVCTSLKQFRNAIAFYRRVLAADPENVLANQRIKPLVELVNDYEDVAERMKSDWNERAGEDAAFYVHSTKRRQSEEEFDASGKKSVAELVQGDLETIAGGRDPKTMKVLEIGCGLGRMTKHMAGIFGEVHGIDVSGEMILRARERLKGLENVFLRETGGKDLSDFPEGFFDFVFSFIVFQHIPSREVVLNYIREAHRVLKPGGIFKFQVQGCTDPAWLAQEKDTWHGATITFEDISEISKELGFGMLKHHGQGTQYSWYNLRKDADSVKESLDEDNQGSGQDQPYIPGLVSIVIPVFNKLDYTRRCLQAVRKNTPDGKYEVIIVDNASTDGTGEFLASLDGDLRVITNSTNKGFTMASNQGARAARGEYVLFLNNDTEPQAHWLESMLELMDTDERIGIAGSRLVYPDGRLQEAGGIIFSDGSGWNFGRFDDRRKPVYSYVREVDYVSGASLLVRHSLLKELNYFDERYSPGYYEDTDLCFGARSLGYRVVYCPFSIVVHHEGVSGGTDLRSGMKRYQSINREKFVQKWGDVLKGQYPPAVRNVVAASERDVKRNILIIDPYMPLYDRASGGLRLYTIVTILREIGCHVTYIAADGRGQETYAKALRKAGVEVYSACSAKPGGKDDEGFHEKADLKAVLSSRDYDLAVLSFYDTARKYIGEIRGSSPSTTIAIDTVDIHFIREMRMAELSNDKRLLKKAGKTRETELAVYRKADAIITVTERDWEHVKEHLPGVMHFVIPNIHEVSDEPAEISEREGLVFVGNFNHPPNADAVRYFVSEILPVIHRDEPQMTLTVVGNNPPDEILKLRNEHVTVTGYVPSTEPYLRRARVSVAPLRYGAGMKGKIGEAMACGLPVVTTPIGAEGMGLMNGVSAFIAEGPEEFAKAVLSLYRDEVLWRNVAGEGKTFIMEHYSKGRVGSQISQIIDGLPNSRVAASASRETEAGLTSIVILTFNEIRYTRECVESIRRHTPEPHEIIFVDNGSTDGTVKWLRQIVKENGNYRLVENEANHGFAKGCNQGIEAASGEYILLLNNDVVVTDGWLSGMLACARDYPGAGIVGPLTNNISGIQKVGNPGYQSPDRLDEYAKMFRERNRFRRIAANRVVGFCMLFRRELIESIGPMDESFGSGNFEDDDLCLRAALAGYRNVIAGDVFIHHYGSRSFIGNRIDYTAAMVGNRRLFKDKWNQTAQDIDSGKRLAALRSMERAEHFAGQGMLEEATKEFLGAVKHSPESGDIYLTFARQLISERRFRDALSVLEEMPKTDEDPQRPVLEGYCREGLESYEEAEVAAERALLLSPGNAEALNLKGILAYRKGKAAEAEALFVKAWEADPSYGEPHTNIGVLKWSSGEKEEAVAAAEKGFILSPDVPDIASTYHTMISVLGRFGRAEEIFREARDLHPSNKRIAFLLIDILIRQNKYEAASAEIEDAIVSFGADDGILKAALEVRGRKPEGGKGSNGKAGGKKTLSLCMIVKNEEKYLARCLRSVRAVVDEMIVVDTGSDDRTKEIARAFGATVAEFQWTGDFSEARNLSLSLASCDWILVLDADEVISAEDHQALVRILKARNRKEEAYSITTRNYVKETTVSGWTPNDGRYKEEAGSGWYPSTKARLFPRDSRIRFENPVHELVEPSLKKAGIGLRECGVVVHHFGKLRTGRVLEKGEEYYSLGEKKLEERSGDGKALFELAVQATELGRHEEAAGLWSRFVGRENSSKDYMARAHLNLGGCLLELGRFQEALVSSKTSFELDPGLNGAVLNYALAEVCLGGTSRAEEVLEGLARRQPQFPAAKILLSAAYLVSGRRETGMKLLRDTETSGIDSSIYYHDYAKKLNRAGRTREAILLLEASAESGHINKDAASYLVKCYMTLSAKETAEPFLCDTGAGK